MTIDYEKLAMMRSIQSPFARFLGIRTTEIKAGYARGEMDILPEYRNGVNSVHGGCIFSLADTIAGGAAISRGGKMTTLSSDINYLAPALESKRLYCEAREIKKGKTICVIDAEVKDEKDKLLAKGTFTFFRLAAE